MFPLLFFCLHHLYSPASNVAPTVVTPAAAAIVTTTASERAAMLERQLIALRRDLIRRFSERRMMEAIRDLLQQRDRGVQQQMLNGQALLVGWTGVVTTGFTTWAQSVGQAAVGAIRCTEIIFY